MFEIFVLKESLKNYLCPNCGKDGGRNCTYGAYDYWGDFECMHENAENLECPCYETFCIECYKKRKTKCYNLNMWGDQENLQSIP